MPGRVGAAKRMKAQAVKQLAKVIKPKKPTLKEQVKKIKKDLRKFKPELKHHQTHAAVGRTVTAAATGGAAGCYFTVADGLFSIDEGIDDSTRVGESLSTSSAVVDLHISPPPANVGHAYGMYDTDRRVRVIAVQIKQGPYPSTPQLLPYPDSDGTYLTSIFDPDLKKASGFKVLHDKIYTYQRFRSSCDAAGNYIETTALPGPMRIRLRLKPKMKLQWDGALGTDLLNPVFIYVLGDSTDINDAILSPVVQLKAIQHWFRDN